MAGLGVGGIGGGMGFTPTLTLPLRGRGLLAGAWAGGFAWGAGAGVLGGWELGGLA